MFLPDWEWELPPPFLAWSADSRWLLAVDRGRVVRISAESGEKRFLTSPPPGIFGDGSLAVSPDGKTLAFTRTITYSVSDLYTVPISQDLLPTSEPRRITSDSQGDYWPGMDLRRASLGISLDARRQAGIGALAR